MTFVKLDDQFQDHPSMIGLSMAAIGLWTVGLAYCSRFLTDGEIPRRALFRLCPQADAELIAAELVEAGRWIETSQVRVGKSAAEEGWVVESYLQHNTSRARVEEIRAKRAEAGAIGGQSNGQARTPKSEDKQTRSKLLEGCFDTGKPDTETDTEVETENKTPSRPPSEAPSDESFEVFWKAYPPRNGKRLGKQTALALWQRMSRTKRETAMRGVLAYAAHCRKTDQLAKDAHRWLRDGLYEEWASDEMVAATPPPPSPMPVFVADEKPADFGAALRHLQLAKRLT